jgi:EpsI family protein
MNTRVPWIIATLMCLTSLGSMAVLPGKAAGPKTPTFLLEATVPKQFADWKLEQSPVVQVVNPETQELLDRLYSQILTRTYVNPQGYRVMLSLAYGDDQRGGLQAHKPEICYPAQGFTLTSNAPAQIATDFGTIPGRHLTTNFGQRYEPVTYWFNVGNSPVDNRLQKRLAEMRLVLTGQAPDGLLFRVSSIDTDPARAFSAHERFVKDLMAAVPPAARNRLSGL